MASPPAKPQKQKCHSDLSVEKTNKNSETQYKYCRRQLFLCMCYKHFADWYKYMFDNKRTDLEQYLADDVVLEWFGKNVESKSKVAHFLTHDVKFSEHYFTTVKRIESRCEQVQREDDCIVTSPSTEIKKTCAERNQDIGSQDPQCSEGRNPQQMDDEFISKKGVKSNSRSNTSTTPSTLGAQDDCLPSTSAASSSQASSSTVNALPPKLSVECIGFVHFIESRNIGSTKWVQGFELQVCYSEDPKKAGVCIIWAISYCNVQLKCRRNLLSAFEEAPKNYHN